MRDVAVDDVEVNDRARRAELFDEFLFQPIICCHHSLFRLCPSPSRQEPADLLFNYVGDEMAILRVEGQRHTHIQRLFENSQRAGKMRNVNDLFPAVIAAGEGLGLIIAKPF